MLTSATLNRVSHSYRRGYQNGYALQHVVNSSEPTSGTGVPTKPFTEFDYESGFEAGLNDYFWERVVDRTCARAQQISQRAAFMAFHLSAERCVA